MFKATRYVGKPGCLTLIVNEGEMKRVAKNNTLNCDHTTMPALLNPKISDKTTPVDEKTLAAEHKQI